MRQVEYGFCSGISPCNLIAVLAASQVLEYRISSLSALVAESLLWRAKPWRTFSTVFTTSFSNWIVFITERVQGKLGKGVLPGMDSAVIRKAS